MPEKVAQLELDNVWAGWIIASHTTLEEREKKLKFYQESTNPERMLENFLARSTWFNDWIQEQVTKFQMNILPQPGGNSVDQLCNLILENLDG